MPALLFDLDGTLSETDPIHEMAWLRMLRQHGVELGDDGYLKRIRGKANPAIVAELLPHLNHEQQSQVIGDKERSFRDHASALTPLPGALDLLQRAQRSGWQCAVVTNAPPENANHVLSSLALAKYFQTVVTISDVAHPKPHPEPFQLALSRLGVLPEHAVAFDDSPSGVRSANSAGVFVAGLLTGHGAAELEGAGAHITTPDFRDSRLLAWVNERLG